MKNSMRFHVQFVNTNLIRAVSPLTFSTLGEETEQFGIPNCSLPWRFE
jgi:hypothetical protein